MPPLCIPSHWLNLVFLKWANTRPLFVYFRPFVITISKLQIVKSIDGVLGIRTQDRRMVGAGKTTELWRHPLNLLFMFQFQRNV